MYGITTGGFGAGERVRRQIYLVLMSQPALLHNFFDRIPCFRSPGRFVILILLLAVASPSIPAQSFDENNSKLRSALDAGDKAAAISILLEIGSRDRAAFESNDFDYLLARLESDEGKDALALPLYQAVAARNSVLACYALWHMAEIARGGGNWILERQLLTQLLALFPDHLLSAGASKRLGISLYESGSYEEAISALTPLAALTKSDNSRQLSIYLAQAYLKIGQPQKARDVYVQLETSSLSSGPDDYSLAAVRALDQLDSESSTASRKLDETEHLRRASIYHFNRDFGGARNHYKVVAETRPDSPGLPDAVYQIGRCYYQERRFSESLEYFDRVVRDFPAHPYAKDALGFKASALARLGQYDDSVATYRTYISLYPAGPGAERPYLNIIDTLRDARRDTEALSWVQMTRDRFKGQPPATLALFSSARLHAARGEWQAALSDLDNLAKEPNPGGLSVSGGTTATEIAFLRGFALEQLRQFTAATDTYLSIPEGRDQYYGQRATERLRRLAAAPDSSDVVRNRLAVLVERAHQALTSRRFEEARANAQSALRVTTENSSIKDLFDVARQAYANLPAYKPTFPEFVPIERKSPLVHMVSGNDKPVHRVTAEQLLFLGLYDEGVLELAASFLSKATPNGATSAAGNGSALLEPTPAESLALAVYASRADRADLAIRYAEPFWKKIPQDYLFNFAPREVVTLLYPAPFKQALLQEAPKRGVDPRFVLSIGRQESRFKSSAKSGAAARGLLQFIPSTADEIAKQLGLATFDQQELYDPSIAILFGSQYLGNLFKQFPEMPQAVAASYNGGEDNVSRWVTRARSTDPDRYTCEIGFSQSKDYVFKVLANFHVYSWLYTADLGVAPTADSVP
jgi:soluble lytic murein transglycosylase